MRWLPHTIAAAAVVLLPVVSSSATAAASTVSPWDCPSDAVGCIFDRPGGWGDRYVIRYRWNHDLPRGWWDKAESVRINAGKVALFNYTASGLEYVLPWRGRGNWEIQRAMHNQADRVHVDNGCSEGCRAG
ncbi:hypothetical protein ACFWY5_40850 [Nonomuraea sp. NPDC059007]|uniref:hypothetical protein n=1 Tax=Nonomuraea sp. NPDC059007 TaxID=3346692 RepID=UPI0036A7E57A